MSYVVTVNFGSGDIDLANYSGENLVRQKSFSKKEALYNNKTFKPDINTAKFEIDLNTTLLATIMGLDNDALASVSITKDGSGWFKGFIRPVTDIKVRSGGGDTISISCVDMGWILKEQPASNAQKSTSDSMTVLDMSSTSNSIVHWILSEAGFTGTVYGSDITDSVDYMRIYYTDYFEALSEILFSYHNTFYFDGSGDFHVYDWGPSSISSSGTIDDDNMIDTLSVSRKDDDTNEVHVKSYRLNVNIDAVLSSRKWTSEEIGSYDASSIGPVTLEIAPPNERVEWFADTEYRYHLYYGINHMSGGFDVYQPLYGWQYASLPELTVTATDHDTYWSVLIEYALVPAGGKVGSTYALSEIQIRGDVVTVSDAEEMKAGSGGKIKRFDAKYCYSTSTAAELAQTILDNLTTGTWIFKWTSQDDLALGDYYTASNVAADISSTVRILSKSARLKSGQLFYEYEAVSTSAISAATETVAVGELSSANTAAEISSAIAAVKDGLGAGGTILQPIIADNLPSVDSGEPGVSGLAFFKDRMGFYDSTIEDWPVYIADDGTFKFSGTGSNAIEFDGTDLTVNADVALNGTVTTGDAIQSDNFSTGVSGWQIDGDGDAEFNSLTIRKEVYEANITNYTSGLTIGYDGVDIDYPTTSTHTLPSSFTIDCTITPSFAYTSTTAHHVFSFYLSANQFISLIWYPSGDVFRVAYADGGGTYSLYSQQFDDGTSFSTINQKIRFTFSADLSVSDLYNASFRVKPLESGEAVYDLNWDGLPPILTSTISGVYVGEDHASANTFIGDIHYLNVYDSQELTVLDIDAGGYTPDFTLGTGIKNAPAEGGRRVLIDNDQISMQEYTDGAWSDYNQIRLGGADTDGIFYPFLKCRGLLHPQATELNTSEFGELLPGGRVYHFENTWADNYGGSLLSPSNGFSTSIFKFGTRSAVSIYDPSTPFDDFDYTFGYADDEDSIPSFLPLALTSDITFGGWLYRKSGSTTPAGNTDFISIINKYGSFLALEYVSVAANYDYANDEISIRVWRFDGDTSTKTSYSSTAVSLTTDEWHYVCILWDASTETASLFVDGTIEQTLDVSSYSVMSLSNVDSRMFHVYIGRTPDDTVNSGLHIDELFVSPSTLVDADALIQHYNRDRPWGSTSITDKDIIIRPAAGGRVVTDYPAGYIYGLETEADTDSDHDVKINPGKCRSYTDLYNLDLTAAITKQIDATWAAGDDAGGLFSGTVAADTTYHLFLIRKDSDGSIDAGWDTDINCANIPSGYTAYRGLRTYETNASANIKGGYPYDYTTSKGHTKLWTGDANSGTLSLSEDISNFNSLLVLTRGNTGKSSVVIPVSLFIKNTTNNFTGFHYYSSRDYYAYIRNNGTTNSVICGHYNNTNYRVIGIYGVA